MNDNVHSKETHMEWCMVDSIPSMLNPNIYITRKKNGALTCNHKIQQSSALPKNTRNSKD